jgi:hypothetical protein
MSDSSDDMEAAACLYEAHMERRAKLAEDLQTATNNASVEICANYLTGSECLFFAFRKCSDIPCGFNRRKLSH